MSAQGGDPQPSIDDILSSIREIIADDSAASRGETRNEARTLQPQDRAQTDETDSRSNILTVLRGQDAPDESADEPTEAPEDVLDLSEEYIVTEAAAAVQRAEEQQGHSQPETDENVTADGESLAADDDQQHQTGTTAATPGWPPDYQMPVGDDGPASPFIAGQAHPEDTWPSPAPFDAMESYKRARARGGAGYRTGPEVSQRSDQEFVTDEEDMRVTDEQAATGSSTHVSANPAETEGIELTSRSDFAQQEQDQSAPAAPAMSPGNDHVADRISDEPPEPAKEYARGAQVEEDIEAVFGMPPRQWTAPAQPTHADWRDDPDDDTQGAGESGSGERAAVAPSVIDDAAQTVSAETDDQMLERDSAMQVSQSQPAAKTAPEPAQQPQPSGTGERAGAKAVSEAAFGEPASPGAKTLEDSVKELLRPMLQEWLDKNMPRLVEAAMRDEVGASQARQISEHESQPAGDQHDDSEH